MPPQSSSAGASARGSRNRLAGERPRRGNPADTRARLVASAAEVFNRVGYRGTDSNRLARAAGYAPGTFYKHFPDKRAIFLAAYEAWVTAEWATVERVLTESKSRAARAAALADAILAMHRRWRGLRASLRALVADDPVARTFYRAQRRRQLELLARMSAPRGAPAAPRAEHAVLLYTIERVSDAVADGELRELGLRTEDVVARLRAVIESHLP
jgi:AcrR family transcriptional regulator